jgi:6-phospho-3-hexuloisomerase
MDTSNQKASLIQSNLSLILKEHEVLMQKIDFSQVQSLMAHLLSAKRIFVIGAGRSGFAMRFAAMRLMHFGLNVYVAGETTTPAIMEDDLLIAASGSGTTKTIVLAAEKAAGLKAKVISFSTTTESPLAVLSELVILIPAAQKQDHGKSLSAQYAGSLFEQSILLLMDALFQTMWSDSGIPAEELWKKHANLE